MTSLLLLFVAAFQADERCSGLFGTSSIDYAMPTSSDKTLFGAVEPTRDAHLSQGSTCVRREYDAAEPVFDVGNGRDGVGW